MFKFIKNHEKNLYDSHESTITMETNSEQLFDILRDFENFLRGCGYVIDGTIELVRNDNE